VDASAQKTERQHFGGSTSLILVIEDNADINDTISLLLEEAGYRTVSVLDGREAIEEAQLYRPDLITLDLMMPGKDGWAIAGELVENPRTQNVPIVIITAYPLALDRELRRQVAGIITKPFHIDRVTSEIDAILRRRADDESAKLAVPGPPE
jgi:two-component system OmpR family response regulator